MSKINIGTRAQVYYRSAYKTTDGLRKEHLIKEGNRIFKKQPTNYKSNSNIIREEFRRQPYGQLL